MHYIIQFFLELRKRYLILEITNNIKDNNENFPGLFNQLFSTGDYYKYLKSHHIKVATGLKTGKSSHIHYFSLQEILCNT